MRAGSAAIAFGSAGRMKAGSTTTAAAPPAAKRRRPVERVVALELPLEREAGQGEGTIGELPDVVQRAGAEDVVAVGGGLVGHAAQRRLAQDHDHPLDVVGREAPVALRLQVAERERRELLAAAQRARRGRRACGRGTAAAAAVRLVVEEDAAGDTDPVRLAVAAAEHVRRGLRGRVGALRVERRRLVVHDALARDRAEHLARGGLVEARRGAVVADRVEQVGRRRGRSTPRSRAGRRTRRRRCSRLRGCRAPRDGRRRRARRAAPDRAGRGGRSAGPLPARRSPRRRLEVAHGAPCTVQPSASRRRTR